MSTAPRLQIAPGLRSKAFRAAADRIGIGYALVDNYSFEEACAAIIEHARSSGEPAYVITPNAQHIVLLQKEVRLREIYRQADLVVPDGISLLWAARVYGRYFPERVPGVDLFQQVCAQAAENNLRVFLLGGRPGSADMTATRLKHRYPNLQVTTYCPPLHFEKDGEEMQRTTSAIQAARPDLLFVALGAPKQEYWIYEHGRKLGVPVCMGVGGTFEMVAGVVQRAPAWIQDLGCEWLYRLCLEPRRMWKRYLIGNVQFLWVVIQQSVRRATLNFFFSLLEKEPFAAELSETTVRKRTTQLLSRLAALSSSHPLTQPPTISSSKEVLPL